MCLYGRIFMFWCVEFVPKFCPHVSVTRFVFHIISMRAASLAHFIFLELIILHFGDEYKLWKSPPPIFTSCLCRYKFLLGTLFRNILLYFLPLILETESERKAK
jgi:hypothetical protein